MRCYFFSSLPPLPLGFSAIYFQINLQVPDEFAGTNGCTSLSSSPSPPPAVHQRKPHKSDQKKHSHPHTHHSYEYLTAISTICMYISDISHHGAPRKSFLIFHLQNAATLFRRCRFFFTALAFLYGFFLLIFLRFSSIFFLLQFFSVRCNYCGYPAGSNTHIHT